MAGHVVTMTASMLRSYKSCHRKFELEYIEQLKPVEPPGYFKTGSDYHSCIEHMLSGREWCAEDDVVGEMVTAFNHYINWHELDIVEVEFEFDIKISRYARMAGKIDALTLDGFPIEHKTSSSKLDERYIRNLIFDDQVSFYLLSLSLMRDTPVTKCFYTVCQKPTIRHTAKESREEYLDRVREWYAYDTESKIGIVTAVRSEKQLQETEYEVREIIKEIRKRKLWYRNPSNCLLFECPYAPICMNYDPDLTSGFVKKERESEELCLATQLF